MVTINTQFPFESIKDIYDNKNEHIQLFKSLLNAVINDDFSEVSSTPNELKNLYFKIREDVEKFIYNNIYERIYKSNAYDGLMESFVDIYALLYLMVYLKGHISNITIQPDHIVDAYLDSFGFPGKELFNYIQKREIAKTVFWYLKRKGTPALVVKFLEMLGFSFFFFAEFDLCESNDDDTIPDSHAYVSRLIYEERPDKDSISIYEPQSFSFNEVKDEDPISFSTNKQLEEDKNYISFPSQSSYYQIAIGVTYPRLELTNSAYSYAMFKKTLIDMDAGENVYTVKIPDYKNKTSYIGAILAYNYIINEYFGINSNSDLYTLIQSNEELSQALKENKTLYDSNGNIISSSISNINDYNGSIYIIKDLVFGYNGDITGDTTPLDIMNDITFKIENLFQKLKWKPHEIYATINSEITFNSNTETNIDINDISITRTDTITLRKEKVLQEIREAFYCEPLFKSYDEMIQMFINHDSSFKEFIDSIILTEEERITLINSNDEVKLDKHFNQVIELLNNILEALEYNIFDNTSKMLPVKNLALSYENIMEILKKIEEYYTPYRAKMINPLILWVIRDLPGDFVAIDDGIINITNAYNIRDVVWRADHFQLYDIEQPEAYVPIYDFDNINTLPHIPISENYLDPLIYDNRSELQINNPYLYCTGYDWRNLKEKPLIVRNESYVNQYDFDPDIVQSDNSTIIIDVLDHMSPSKHQLELIDQYNTKLESLKRYINVYKEELYISNTTHTITHNLDSEDIFVTIYDLDTGKDIHCNIIIIDSNTIELHFNSQLIAENNIRNVKVLIICPSNNPKRLISGRLFDLIDYNILQEQSYMLLSDMNSKDLFIESYNRSDRTEVQFGFKRYNDSVSYVTLKRTDKPALYNFKHRYKVNLVHPLDYEDQDIPRETLFASYILENITQSTYTLEHNFCTNNILVRVYDLNTKEQVNPLIIRDNSNKLTINFGNKYLNQSYKVILLGVLERFYKIAVPLNNLTGYSGSITINSSNNSYIINHDLNSYNTFEQIIDKSTGELVNCNYNRLDENRLKVTFSDSYVQNNSNKELSVLIVASLNLNGLSYPSTIYNTYFKSFDIEYSLPNITDYQITHNMNNKNLLVQVYDNYNMKVNTYVKIIDENKIQISLNKSLVKDESLKVNILSLPDKSKAFLNYNVNNDNNQTYSFITMYDQVIKNSDINDHLLYEYIGGDSSTEYEDEYIGGTSSDEYDNIMNMGKSDTGVTKGPSTITINHNMNTETVIVNLFNEVTKETINCYVAINDLNNVTIGILDDIDEYLDDFHVLIIGALENTINSIDNKELFDSDSITIIPGYGYKEFKTKLDNTSSYHISYYNQLYDLEPNYITEDYDETNRHLTYSIQRYDVPTIRERVDILHEIKNPYSDSNITKIIETETEFSGFNDKDILTNMPIWSNEEYSIDRSTLEIYS